MTVGVDKLRLALAQSLVMGLEGLQASPRELARLAEEGLGGVILFGCNLGSPREIWELNRSLSAAALKAGRPSPFIMVDQEGGSVTRLKAPFTEWPDLAELGQRGEAAVLYHQGMRVGTELRAAGFNFNLAPVLDVHALADGVMARRSLGSDPALVGELGAAYIQGLQATGCLACAKHFPGLGRTILDTHHDRPLVELALQELGEMELWPFRRAAAAGVAGIMVCHAVFTALDPGNTASLSPLVVDGLLRREMGFGGLILSDDLEMGAVTADLTPAQAAVKAYLAGCDLLLICHRAEFAPAALDELTAMAEAGEIDPARVEASSARIARFKSGLLPAGADFALLEKILAST
jgi:beta-N-acetylhexosaminidase